MACSLLGDRIVTVRPFRTAMPSASNCSNARYREARPKSRVAASRVISQGKGKELLFWLENICKRKSASFSAAESAVKPSMRAFK